MNATEDNAESGFEILFHCDCCGRELSPNKDIEEFQESLHVRYHARQGSKYIEPGSLVQCVLCQGCISVILGRWLRVTPGHANSADAEAPIGDLPLYFALVEKILEEEDGDDKKLH
jgi:hypothetical protein